MRVIVESTIQCGTLSMCQTNEKILFSITSRRSFYSSDVSSSPIKNNFDLRHSPCDDGDDDAVAAAAAAFASLSTLSASLMCGVDGPGMLRKWAPSDDDLRLGVAGGDQAEAVGEVD